MFYVYANNFIWLARFKGVIRCSKETRNIRRYNKQTTIICQITNLLDIHQFLKIPL